MRKSKDFKIKNPANSGAINPNIALVDTFTPAAPPAKKSIEFPRSVSSQRVFDFEPYYGKGYDQIIYNCQAAIESMLATAIATNQHTLSYGTIISYCNGGLAPFFNFCESWISVNPNLIMGVEDINATLIRTYMKYLESKHGYVTQRSLYFKLKGALLGIGDVYLKHIFPKNPYPNIKQRSKGQKGYTVPERKRLVKALSTEITVIKSHASEMTANELCVCVLWVSLCTGINTQPLFELRVDALQPHLFHPHKRLLVTYKRRGKNTHITSLQGSGNLEGVHELPTRIDAIFTLIESRNSDARKRSEFPESLFVFVPGKTAKAIPNRISAGCMLTATKMLVKKYDLKHDDHTPMVVNITKLRKTFVNRIFELSGHDPVITAALAGHSVQVSDDHYLAPPPDSEKKHAFMGEIRNRELLTGPAERNSVASCKDLRTGHRAPKNGNICIEIFGCFRCKSFVVTGDDLYKIMSFYLYIVSLRSEVGTKRWGKEYAYIIRVIDRDIIPKFPARDVAKARKKALEDPHPLWRIAAPIAKLLNVKLI